MKTFLARFAQDESGATAIEYGLIAAIVGVGIIAGLGNLKTGLNTLFGRRPDRTRQEVSLDVSSWYEGPPGASRRAALFVSAGAQRPAGTCRLLGCPNPV